MAPDAPDAPDMPVRLPDGAMPPRGGRSVPIPVCIAGVVALLLIVVAAALYISGSGDHAAGTAEATNGGAAPEAILDRQTSKEIADGSSLVGSGIVGEQLRPGTSEQQIGAVKQRGLNGDPHINVAVKAAAAATRTPTPAPARPTATPTKSAQATTWNEPDGRFTVRVPAGWTADDSQRNDWLVVELIGPEPQNGPFFYINSEVPADGSTLDDFVTAVQDAQMKNTKFTFKFGAVTDTVVAGEAAKTYTYTYTPKDKPNATPSNGQVWNLLHNGARYQFYVDPIGTHRSEVSSIVSSFAFTDSTNDETGDTTTWTDANGLIALTYPQAWTASTADGDDANVLVLQNDDGLFFSVDIGDQADTIDKEIGTARNNRVKNNTGFTFTFGTVADLQIGGEPAKMVPWTWVSKQKASNKGAGRDYVVNHGGKWFSLAAVLPGNDFGGIDAVVETITFGASNTPGGKVTTWQDKNGQVKLQYPNGWTATIDTSDTVNVLWLQGPDNLSVYIDIFDPQPGTLDEEIQADKDFHAKSQQSTYKDGAVTDLKIGGEPAKALAYTFVPKKTPNATPSAGTIWEVNHGGKEFYIQSSPLGNHAAEVNAIIASIAFGK
jgi:hypothetical protein